MSDKKSLKLTITGCGGSHGVPRIGNNWGVCNPDNPKNHRTTNSIFVEKGGTKILVDCGPDVRQQINAMGRRIEKIDALLITHIHPDHTCGLYKTQAFVEKGVEKLPLYTSGECFRYLKQGFPFFFKENPGYPPCYDVHEIEEGEFYVNDVKVHAVPMDHGNCKTLGFVFDEKICYLTDTISMPEEWFEKLASMNLETLIVECTGYEPFAYHLHFDKSIEWANRIGAKQTYLTDLRINSDYDALLAKCPDTVEPAYDGLEVTYD